MTRIMPAGWALPALDDLNRAFFTRGAIVLQRCTACGTVQHPPEEICHSCLGMDFVYEDTEGTGTIYSFVVVHHPVAPVLKEAVPYAVALVALDRHPQVRVLGNVIGAEPSGLEIGRRVRAVFERIQPDDGEEVLLIPQWEVVRD